MEKEIGLFTAIVWEDVGQILQMVVVWLLPQSISLRPVAALHAIVSRQWQVSFTASLASNHEAV